MQSSSTKPFCLFADCLPLKGISRCIIYDLTRNNYFYIPKDLHQILFEFEGRTIEDVKAAFPKSEHKTIDEYFDFLLSNELIFFTEQPACFPKVNHQDWDEPHQIIQLILDFKDGKNYLNKKFIEELEVLSCQSMQLRFFGDTQLGLVKSIVKEFLNSTIENIEIVIKHKPSISYNEYAELANANLRINKIVIYGASRFEHKGKAGINAMCDIFFSNKSIIGELNCGVITPNNFSINLKTVSESQSFNTCLNRKIGIDVNGNIKNCPSMKESFGNIRETSLVKVVRKKEFQKFWRLKKDDIAVCKDCEFRHICTDCRAYLEKPQDLYSKPLKCGYNPYTNEWEEWSNHPLKQKAIDFYGMQELVTKDRV